MRADALARTVRRYRIMAYITGVVLIILCFVGIPLQVQVGRDDVHRSRPPPSGRALGEILLAHQRASRR